MLCAFRSMWPPPKEQMKSFGASCYLQINTETLRATTKTWVRIICLFRYSRTLSNAVAFDDFQEIHSLQWLFKASNGPSNQDLFTDFSFLVLLRHAKTEEPAHRVPNTILTNVDVNKDSWENIVRKVIVCLSFSQQVYLVSAVAKN